MFAGHFTTALVAKQRAPRAHLAYLLFASQLPDLLWVCFHFMGIEPTTPSNPMTISLDTMTVDMTYSHDLLPFFGWLALVVVLGRALFGAWRPGLMGGAMLALHVITDYAAGHPHNVFGPDSHSVASGLYKTAPYTAVVLEGVFIVAMLAWVVRSDRAAGIRRASSAYWTWAFVFGGGFLFMLSTADLSMSEALGVDPIAALDGGVMLLLGTMYLAMIAALSWAGAQPHASAPNS